MPIKMFRNHQRKLADKNVMVLAVVGGQSSGKSNLLNFLFGCDFLSSQGRCTSGVYMTYYEIQGQNIPGCDGILVLDTEGLFSNHVRQKQQAKNFDNKLLLFLLKTVDILIVNCQGQIKKDIQEILQLSFDSQLMKFQPGIKYPHFNIVLNMKPDSMNSQNITEIQILRQNIVQNNPEMEKFISSQQSNQLPFAFTSRTDQGMDTFLNSIQRNEKIATKKFYQGTRLLSLNLLNILKKRGVQYQPRTIEVIYDQMFSAWSTLLRFPILTQHVNRRLKQFEDAVQKFMCQKIQHLVEIAKTFNSQIPNKILEIDSWMEKRLEQIEASNKRLLDEFEITFVNKSIDTNDLAARYKDKFTDKLKSFQTNFKLQITESKYKLSLSQSQNRGLQNLNKKARQLRSIGLNEQQKEKQFYKGWSKYTEGIQQKIDRRRNSQQIFHNVQLFYNNHMKDNQIIRLNQFGYEQSNYQTFQEYFQQIKGLFSQKIQNINAIQGKQIQPVISISSQQTTDLKYKYFDMRMFFQPVPTNFFYYLNYKSLNSIIRLQQIKKKIQFQLRDSQIIKNFILYLKKDMSFFGAKFNKQQIINKLVYNFNHPQNYQTNIYFNKYDIEVDSKTCQRNFQILKSQQHNQNFYQLKDYPNNHNHNHKDKGQKKNYNNNNKYSNSNNNKNENKQKQKQGQMKKKQSQYWNQFEKTQNFKLFQVYQVKNAFEEAKKWWHTSFYNGNKAEDVVKFLTRRSIKNYVQFHLDYYRQTLNSLRQKYVQQSFMELNKIGIFPKRYRQNYQYYYANIYLEQIIFEPIQVERYSQIFEIINGMSSFIDKKNLSTLISQQKITDKYYSSQCVAYSSQKKIDIKEDFKIYKQLQRYKDRQYDWLYKNIKNKGFINFVKKYIKFENILIEIKKTIEQTKGQVKIKDFVSQVAIVIKKQLQDFNLDLKQISHRVSIQFIYLIHELTKKLIWKKLQIERMKKIKQQQQKLKQVEKEQRRIFFGNLQLNSEPRSRASAAMFVDIYKKFVEPLILEEKQKFLEQKQLELLSTYTRKTIQDYVDTEMMKCSDPDVLIQYLRQPGLVIKSFYNNFLERKIQQIQNQFYCENKNCVIELQKIFKQMLAKYSNQDPFKWEVDVLFEQKCVKQKDKDQLAITLKNILVEVVMNGQTISSDYNYNKYQLKEEVLIEGYKPISHHINYNFLNTQLQFEIMNLAHFVKFAYKGLEGFKKDVQQISNFTSQQLDKFRQKSKLVLCDKVCPCCDRLCDVDMRIDPHHTVHRIDSGHQMRAVKGMVVQKITQKGKEQFASVIRCQDVGPKDTFQFYGQQYQWQFFKQLKSNEWSFDSKQVNKLVFQKIWGVCGQKLCEQFTKNGKPMKFIEYSEGNINFIQQSQQNTEFIFAIDGSGSMSGSPWDDQLKGVQTILSSISKDPSNTASILVFTTQCKVFCAHQKPGPINVKQIQFPSGGTTPDPTFIEAARIAMDINSRQQKNIYFFYISDGYADHPTEGIRRLLQCKQKLEAKNLKFTYTSILIGQCSTGRSFMNKVNDQMGGISQFVANASNLGQKMKEILRL